MPSHLDPVLSPTDFANAITGLMERTASSFSRLRAFEDLVAPSLVASFEKAAQAILTVESADPNDLVKNRPATADFQEALGRVLEAAKRHKDEILQHLPSLQREMQLVFAVAIHDAAVADSLRLTFLREPRLLKSGAQLPQSQVVDLAVSGKLLQFVAEREVERVTFLPARRQAEYLQQRVGAKLPADLPIDQLVEICARRNLIVHAAGVANERYCKEVGNWESLGKQLDVSEIYLRGATGALGAITFGWIRGLRSKFEASSTSSASSTPEPLAISELQEPAAQERKDS